MSTYVISDMHGCKKEFDQMLDLIQFSDYDNMWIVGDVCDRGRQSIALLNEIIRHDNMHLIFGNHDVWLARYAQTLINAKKNPSSVTMTDDLMTWLHFNGGYKTADEFMDLNYSQCYDIKLYLEKRVFYENLEIEGQKYLLIHAGLEEHCRKNTVLSAVPENELIWAHIGLEDNPFDNVTMIVGHTPTFLYGQEYDGRIVSGKKKKILHIDCGCVYGRSLGCVRLEDRNEFYVPSSYPYLKF